MLSRATCTIYLAQESDTLGKDSELAVTLAQGKPVIAYVPEGDQKYVDELIELYMKLENADLHATLVYLYKTFKPNLAWEDSGIRRWLDSQGDDELMRQNLYSIVREAYDARARTLKELHPLGIQVDINSGLAVGVLVVRSIEVCVKLLKSIILQDLNFHLEERENHFVLVENVSESVYRVMTKDDFLSNAFWNYYL